MSLIDEHLKQQLDRIEAMLNALPKRRRRPADGSEKCGNCISWTQNKALFTPIPEGACTAGYPTATALPVAQQVMDKNGKRQIAQSFMPMTAYPSTMQETQWCEHWYADPEQAGKAAEKSDLMEKLAEQVREKDSADQGK